MASVIAPSDRMKLNKCLNPSKRVRIVGKIRGFTDQESESLRQDSSPWITVKKPQEGELFDRVTVAFKTPSTSCKNVYELDCCYEQDEDIEHIYSREIQSIISEVFEGRNASIIALGARGSGKTFTIQGSIEKPGLAIMAMREILWKANESKKTISVSLYQVTQDHAYDVLDPEHAEIQVLEDAQGKINLKGLSQVTVKSIPEFQNIYFRQLNFQRTQKISMDPRNHKGLMVHISSEDDKLPKLVNKINFVDLAGYEDLRKNSNDGVILAENKRTNKSLFALVNVVIALSANENRVPYRESKLTRILQDSLGGTSQVLVLACLNPFFCKDSVSSMSFISRSFQSTKQVLTDSTNISHSLTKVKVLSSLKSGKTSTPLIAKKQTGCCQYLSGKKASCISKGRKLFDEESANNPKQLRCLSEDTSARNPKILCDQASAVTPFSLEEALHHESSQTIEPIEDGTLLPHVLADEAIILVEKDLPPCGGINPPETTTSINSNAKAQTISEAADGTYGGNKDGAFVPLSQRIKEISDNLKLICSSTPLRVKMPEEGLVSYNSQVVGCNDSTPVVGFDSVRYCSPRGTFINCGSSLKHSLVKEHLKFLNSANKEELKKLRGIGEKRATYILKLREESPEPFKSLDDLQEIGLSAKQVKDMMKGVAAELFH